MIRSTADFFTGIMQRWLPDAFLFAVILTFVVFLGGVLGEAKSPLEMVTYWGDGFWDLLKFAMQMLMILVTGHVLAKTALVSSGLAYIAGLVKTPGQAIVVITVVALIACWINWGFGLIVGALLAREIAQRVEGVHYALLVASAYTGLIIWHAGLSGSIPMKIAVPGTGALDVVMKGQSIPVTETIFSGPVLIVCVVLLVTLPLINRMMMPAPEDVQEIPKELLNHQEPPGVLDKALMTPAQRMENSIWISLLLGSLGMVYLCQHFIRGGSLGLDTINFILLTLGILLHKNPASYLNALREAISGVSGIVLQFPLYAGIMAMMVQSGLAASISSWFVGISTATTFPLFTFLSAGVVNFFVPSGGGQWAVQAPIVIPAAEALGVPLNKAAMAVAFGDAWTNMIQPFWALPLLGIAGLGIKDIMGYCTVALLWSGLVIGLAMLFLF